MKQKYIHVNITLPEDLNEQINNLFGKRKKSPFIADLIRRELQIIERAKLDKELEKGYKARRAESLELIKEFDCTLLDGLEND